MGNKKLTQAQEDKILAEIKKSSNALELLSIIINDELIVANGNIKKATSEAYAAMLEK